MFQSRNRGSFDFKFVFNSTQNRVGMFQSRNRGSFDFKDFVIFSAEFIDGLVSIS